MGTAVVTYITYTSFLLHTSQITLTTVIMSAPEQFEGWAAMDESAIKGNFQKWKYTPKTWEETDVDIKIKYCGICASDSHTAGGGWGKPEYPIVVGHEIVGEAVRVGKDVKHVKVGDTVGVGAQCGSCLECERCQTNLEPYCDAGQVGTYAGKFKKGPAKGDRSQGGYSNYNRSPGHFVIKIPDEMDPAVAAPMLCGGVTVYSPLKKHGAGTDAAKNVGVVGLGGLGHFAVLFAAHMGAEVTVVSHSHSKEEDAKKMGAKHFIATAMCSRPTSARSTSSSARPMTTVCPSPATCSCSSQAASSSLSVFRRVVFPRSLPSFTL